jgi:hypothetical protein
LATLKQFRRVTEVADTKTAIRGWPFGLPERAVTSRLIDSFLDRILGFAHGLLGFAFLLLHFTFGLQLGAVGGFTHTLLDVASRFVCHAFNFIASAAHGVSPENNSTGKVVTQRLTGGVCAEFHLFSMQHFIAAQRLGFMFAVQPTRMRNVFRPRH